MSIERDDELDRCPNRKSRYEIAAVKLSIMRETSSLLVCTSCGLARAEAPSTPAYRPGLAWRIAIGLIVTAPAVLYVAMRLLVFEHQPVPTSKLAVSIEQSSSRL